MFPWIPLKPIIAIEQFLKSVQYVKIITDQIHLASATIFPEGTVRINRRPESFEEEPLNSPESTQSSLCGSSWSKGLVLPLHISQCTKTDVPNDKYQTPYTTNQCLLELMSRCLCEVLRTKGDQISY